MTQKVEAPGPKGYIRVTADSIGSSGNLMVGSALVCNGIDALSYGDYQRAAVGVGIGAISTIAGIYGFQITVQGGREIAEFMEWDEQYNVQEAQAIFRREDPVMRTAALSKIRQTIVDERTSLFEERDRVRNFNQSGVISEMVYSVLHVETAETTRSKMADKIKTLAEIVQDFDKGDASLAVDYFSNRVASTIRKSRSFMGQGRKNWSSMLADAEREVRILEDVDFTTATRLRAEIEEARKFSLNWK